jgi:hypothetical protein
MALGVTAYSEAAFSTEDSDVIIYASGIEMTMQENTPAITIDVNVPVTGQELTSTEGTVTTVSGAFVSVTGETLSGSLGDVTESSADADVPVTGFELTTNVNNPTHDTLTAFGEAPFATLSPATFNIPVQVEATVGGIAVGTELPMSLGNVAAVATSEVLLSGQELTMQENSATVTADANISITGQALTATEGTLTLDANTFASVTGEAMTAEEGTVDPAPDAEVTGQEMTSSLGSVSITANADVQLFNGTGPEFSALGNAALSTDQAKFGTSSLELDGTDDFVDSTSNINLSSTDFTVDLWIRPDNVTGYKGIWQSGTSTTEQSYLLGNQVYWTVNPSTIITTSVTVSAGVWTMLSYERQGNTHRIYKNGTLEDTVSTGNKQDNGPFSIGKNGFGDFDGYIDEVRVSDIARYGGSSFTEPTSEFSVDLDTIALLHFDGADGSTDMINALNAEALVLTSNDGTLTVTGTTEVSLTGELLSIAEGNINVAANADVVVTGQELTIQENAPTVTGDANVDLTGIGFTANLGTAPTVSADANVDVTGQLLSIAEGNISITANADISVTGQEMTVQENAPTVTADANVSVTGFGFTANLGTAVLDAVSFIDVTGQAMTMQEGQVDATDSVARPTGIAMTIALGDEKTIVWTKVDTGSTSTWTEVNQGSSGTWTEVDTAA